MKRALVIDDEPLARMVVLEYLQGFSDRIEVLQECNDGFEGLKAIQQHQPDIIFLDIQMPKITGIDFLKNLTDPPFVIFTTAFPEYAIEGYELNILDYLLKPISFERFFKAADQAVLTQAAALARFHNAPLVLVHVVAGSRSVLNTPWSSVHASTYGKLNLAAE